MQTFLPYPDFTQSARCLDTRRLGKQRVETLQILRALAGVSLGWRRHPAVLMWRGYAGSLCDYGRAICREWIDRGYADTCEARICKMSDGSLQLPAWLGDPAFHASHRSNLLRKDPQHYGQFGWTEPPDLPYVWPKYPPGLS